MVRTDTGEKRRHEKDIFITGEYIQHFTPDKKQNPFLQIYARKKQDAINIINASGNITTILDVGGGMGRLSSALSSSEHYKIVLVDISIDMLKLAAEQRESPNDFRILNTDAHQLPFRNDSFDLVVGLDLFCHLNRPTMALREFYRVLKKQGFLIIDSTNSNPLWALFYPRYLGKNPLTWLKIMKFKGILPGWENIVKHYPKKIFFSFLNNTGFKVIRQINYGPVICPKWHLTLSQKSD